VSHGGRFWKGKAIVPDGSISFGDRAHIATVYSGNALVAIVWTTIAGPWLYTAANWSGVEFRFEVFIRRVNATARARLIDDLSAVVAGSELTTDSTSMVRLRSGVLALTDGREYRVQVGDAGAGAIMKAKLIGI